MCPLKWATPDLWRPAGVRVDWPLPAAAKVIILNSNENFLCVCFMSVIICKKCYHRGHVAHNADHVMHGIM